MAAVLTLFGGVALGKTRVLKLPFPRGRQRDSLYPDRPAAGIGNAISRIFLRSTLAIVQAVIQRSCKGGLCCGGRWERRGARGRAGTRYQLTPVPVCGRVLRRILMRVWDSQPNFSSCLPFYCKQRANAPTLRVFRLSAPTCLLAMPYMLINPAQRIPQAGRTGPVLCFATAGCRILPRIVAFCRGRVSSGTSDAR